MINVGKQGYKDPKNAGRKGNRKVPQKSRELAREPMIEGVLYRDPLPEEVRKKAEKYWREMIKEGGPESLNTLMVSRIEELFNNRREIWLEKQQKPKEKPK